MTSTGTPVEPLTLHSKIAVHFADGANESHVLRLVAPSASFGSNLLAACTSDSAVKLYDTTTCAYLRGLSGHEGSVRAGLLLSDRRSAVSSGVLE